MISAVEPGGEEVLWTGMARAMSDGYAMLRPMISPGDYSISLDELQFGDLHHFADWPNDRVQTVSAGIYSIWDGDQFIYVGMAGRGLTADEIGSPDEPVRAKGLRTRLESHASGRRSGDQFCVYVCDRFVVPKLTPAEQAQIGDGTLSLDRMTRRYIHDRLSYRFKATVDGTEAFAAERDIQRGALPAGKPFLNPL